RPVIITGHSLGGAMAAILHGMDEFQNYTRPIFSQSCYTFGMPRYGNSLTTSMLPYPYHTYALKDPAPRLPPELMGYRTSPSHEYCLEAGLVPGNAPQRPSIFLTRLSEHRIETYIPRISRLIP
ncbi:lipase family protein, partial [Massilia cavernae]